MSAPAASRYLSLDAWRGLAALVVMLFHAMNPWLVQSAPRNLEWFALFAGKGWLGVHLFFVISGYCVGQLALREIRGRKSTVGFLRSRFLRIFPPYWAACLVAAALSVAAVPFTHTALFATETQAGALPGSLGAVVSHAFLIDPLLNRESYLLVAWTLSWEISYYLLTGTLVLIGILRSLPLAIALGFLLAAAGAIPVVTSVWPALGGWSEFMCGIAVFAAHAGARENRRAWPWLGAILALGLAGLLLPGGSWPLTFAAAFALLLYLLQRYDAPLSHARAGVWLGWCGLMSYSLYLIHVPVITHLRNLMARFFAVTSYAFLMPIVLAVGASIVAAWLFYLWVESPVEGWRKSLEHRLRHPTI